MSEIRITKLCRDEQAGWWKARVTPEGATTYEVHRRYGSWMRDGETPGHGFELPKAWSVALQERVRRRERAEWDLFEARRQEAVASGRCEAQVRSDASPPAFRALIALQSAPGRVQGRVRDRSRRAEARPNAA